LASFSFFNRLISFSNLALSSFSLFFLHLRSLSRSSSESLESSDGIKLGARELAGVD